MLKKIFRILGYFFSVIIFLSLIALWKNPIQEPVAIGTTFRDFHAENFGLDPKEVYIAMLDDLGIKKLRLAAYWDKVELQNEQFTYDWLDWQINEAAKRDVEIVLAVGRKLPGWPECFIPDWAEALTQEAMHEELLDYTAETINRYKNNPAIEMWQVENEPFLPFGHCPVYEDKGEKLERQIALVHALDPSRQVLVTDSGELSLWIQAAKRSDIFGTTMYRHIYSNKFGYITYPLPAAFFRVKRGFMELFVDGRHEAIVIELQGEPWYPGFLPDAPLEEQAKTMDFDKFVATLDYAKRSGFDTYYTWGVEWWYWMKVTHNDPRIWEYMKEEIAALEAGK